MRLSARGGATKESGDHWQAAAALDCFAKAHRNKGDALARNDGRPAV
jgi:hypothetical protein